eukprot:1942483-Rhodomonas_salina.1
MSNDIAEEASSPTAASEVLVLCSAICYARPTRQPGTDVTMRAVWAYVMCGTGMAYGTLSAGAYALCGTDMTYRTRGSVVWAYAMRSTDGVYDATSGVWAYAVSGGAPAGAERELAVQDGQQRFLQPDLQVRAREMGLWAREMGLWARETGLWTGNVALAWC